MAGGVHINRVKAEAEVFSMAQKAALRGANKYRERVRREILSSGRVQTGEMFTNIEIAPSPPRGLSEARAVVKPKSNHFLFQDQGTKAHSVPKGRFMVFKGKRGVLVFARHVRGVRPGHFLLKARAKMTIEDFT